MEASLSKHKGALSKAFTSKCIKLMKEIQGDDRMYGHNADI